MVLRFEESCVFSLLAFCALSTTTAVVVIRDGGYQNILVTFAPDIAKDDQPKVLLATKDLMTRASSVVHTATGIYFGEVILLLPYTWGNLEDWPDSNVTYSSVNEIHSNADIFVENSNAAVYGTRPYTLQSGGCGIKGIRITLSKDFFDDDTIVETKAKLMAREWIRYRYGVFHENGYPGDDRYPLYFGVPGSGDPTDVHVTGCTDKPVRYSFRSSTGQECSLLVDETGRPAETSTTCSIQPENENNSDVLSSLMYLQDLPSVVYLCDDENHIHDGGAPNKQNSMCQGRSIWNVMKDHSDFINRETSDGTGSPPEPKVKIVLDRNPRIVLAVDSSTIQQYKKDVVQRTVKKFIFDLPDGTEFGLFQFGPKVAEPHVIPFGLLKERPHIRLVFPDSGLPCLECALKEALKDLTDDNTRREGTIVILSSSDSATVSEDMVNKLKNSRICLSIFVLEGSNDSDAGFQQLKNVSSCSHIPTIPQFEESDALKMLTQLSDEFERLIKAHTYDNGVYTVDRTYITKTLSASFRTDESVKGYQIWLTNVGGSLEFRTTDVVLTSENGVAQLQEILKAFSEFLVYQVSDVKGYNWNFQIETADLSAFPILLQVVANKSSSESIRVRAWVEDTTNEEGSENPEQLPVILKAEVTMGINPVLNAKVQAVIVSPNLNTFELVLYDNGLGDPDVTKNDGIYSRYFTRFTMKGDYKVAITFTDNRGQASTAQPPESGPPIPCCGSVIPTGSLQNTGAFERIVHTSFSARGSRSLNGYEPSRVQDLRLSSRKGPRNLTFQWTAPGNEMDTGAAQEYIFKLFSSKEDAEKYFAENNLIGAFNISQPVIPLNYSSKQNVEVHLSDILATNQSYFFAMRSESKEGRQSKTSNVVQIFLADVITSSPAPTDTGSKDGDDKDTNSLKKGSADGNIVGIIVGVCVAVLIILIIAYVAFYILVVRPKRKQNEERRSSRPPRGKSDDATEDTGDGSLPANEWKMQNNSISPVNSWPSNVLVGHHEKVKEAKRKKQKPPVFKLEHLENSPDVVSTISNGLLPNPVYSSHAEDLNESSGQENSSPQQDRVAGRPSRRISHV